MVTIVLESAGIARTVRHAVSQTGIATSVRPDDMTMTVRRLATVTAPVAHVESQMDSASSVFSGNMALIVLSRATVPTTSNAHRTDSVKHVLQDDSGTTVLSCARTALQATTVGGRMETVPNVSTAGTA